MLSRAVVQPKPNRPSGDMLHDCTCDTTKTCEHKEQPSAHQDSIVHAAASDNIDKFSI